MSGKQLFFLYLIVNFCFILRLKMSNASIRIDCYNIPNNKSNANIRLGYLMLRVKEAQIMNPSSNDRVSYIGFIFYTT